MQRMAGIRHVHLVERLHTYFRDPFLVVADTDAHTLWGCEMRKAVLTHWVPEVAIGIVS
jgi:hypothetical protein